MVNEDRPEACIQASRAQQHDDRQFYEHNEWSTKIALKLVYKHLVHHPPHDEKQFDQHKEQ